MLLCACRSGEGDDRFRPVAGKDVRPDQPSVAVDLRHHKVDLAQCPRSRQTRVAESSAERILGLGTVLFTLDEQTISGGGWVNISQPHMVREAVEDAIGKLPPRPHQP